MTTPRRVPTEHRDLLLRAYAAYNAQDLEALTALVSDDVDWPDGEGRLHGRQQVRAYWQEQWTRTRTHDEPVGLEVLGDGRTAARISQVVRSLDGTTTSRGHYVHVHRIEAGRITRLDITAAPTGEPDA